MSFSPYFVLYSLFFFILYTILRCTFLLMIYLHFFLRMAFSKTLMGTFKTCPTTKYISHPYPKENLIDKNQKVGRPKAIILLFMSNLIGARPSFHIWLRKFYKSMKSIKQRMKKNPFLLFIFHFPFIFIYLFLHSFFFFLLYTILGCPFLLMIISILLRMPFPSFAFGGKETRSKPFQNLLVV